MSKNKLLFLLFIFLVSSALAFSVTSCSADKGDAAEPADKEPPTPGECVTYIENEYGKLRLTDTVGFAFEFEVELYGDFDGLDFDIPLWNEQDGHLVTASTDADSELRPKIYVDGRLCEDLPSKPGQYKIRLDISHITTRGYTAGNSLTVNSFGKIDLLCMY